MITTEQIQLLKIYQDKAYVSAILCDKSSNYYSLLKNIFNVPLILASSLMSILNSSQIEENKLKYINIIVNALTALILSLANNFKFQERATNFKTQGNKFNKLVHSIEDNLVNELNNITTDTLRNFITTYDNINENVDFDFPYHIKQDVRRFFLNQRVLPNILNCERSGASPLSTPKLNSDVVINVEKNFSDIE
jgi:hypothetical protein